MTLTQARADLQLVNKGEVCVALVIPDKDQPTIEEAAEYFSAIVERSTGARLPVFRESSVPLECSLKKIFIGDTRKANDAGLNSSELGEETYRIRIDDSQGIVLGHDLIRESDPYRTEANSLPTKWALNRLLELNLGVRWLWPGDLGTYVPKAESLSLKEIDETSRPLFIQRRQRIPQMVKGPSGNGVQLLSRLQREKCAKEAIEWAENHQEGYRGNLLVRGQPFLDWWNKYSKNHPDYFAELPPPLQQPYQNKPEVVKLRLSNPAVIEQIAEEYKSAGKPPVWKISPNDAAGFDTSKETRAWDIPKDQQIEDIVYGNANLTARYIQFWNLVYERLSAINPNIVLNSLAYASYRFPPPKERPLKARMILSLVPSYTEFETWKGWADTGSMLILRPNWWCGGGGAPVLPIGQISEFFKFCANRGMVGFDFDSIHGYWSTLGFSYYLIARLGTNPELTKESILNEYASAFGSAAPQVKQYIEFWEHISNKAGYSVHVGGYSGPDSGGDFERIVKEKGIAADPWVGGLQILPYLYSDEVLAKAQAILDEAKHALSEQEQEEKARLVFLENGLIHLRLLRDTMESGMTINNSKTKTDSIETRFKQRSQALLEFRTNLANDHVIWPEIAYLYEERAQQPTVLQNLRKVAPDWKGE